MNPYLTVPVLVLFVACSTPPAEEPAASGNRGLPLAPPAAAAAAPSATAPRPRGLVERTEAVVDPVLARPSRYHIVGWVTDYEAVGDLDEIRDVIHLGRLMVGYGGPGFRTIEEVGLEDHEMVRYLANDRWTEVVPGAEWPALRAYLVAAVRR